MRLRDVERGGRWSTRLLIQFISMLSGVRLPDAARVAFYDRDFISPGLGQWAQRTMRGPSEWSVAERELMAAAVARRNSCAFCIGAHTAVAMRGMDPQTVTAALEDPASAPISPYLRAAMAFNDKLTVDPGLMTADDARAALASGMTTQQLEDASAVAALFNIITRYADALNFSIPSDLDFGKSAGTLLKRGYH
ncbi:hypothetical protein CVV68_18135 [Arthrobacter livingstonensis]|uniref:Carboxymuconolactone decarboxylase-like domain-containing protein n=1 Tax=Arthrobacter livingstonensis TaxID=670078 RepID=A0A2V5L2K7_9MICC|nr:carboxymuconolactone decarboxylase family protein [Arthrobacter livingstonensis]PYI65489.1 hypothetical protein CVV68_18135 [Arthrobacter livingstonensis]